jgi:hypothetical protein
LHLQALVASMNRPPKPAKTPELGAAEVAVLDLLDNRDFEGAARVVAAYESRQPLPRGIGVNWNKPDIGGDVAALRSIFDSDENPAISISAAAAMMYLWGVSKPFRRWLAREADGDAEATKLVLRAYATRQAAEFERARMLGLIS